MSTADDARPARAILGAVLTDRQDDIDPRSYAVWPRFLYLIHFAEPLHHAQHYLGSSYNLYERLSAHANGRGAKLTKALWENAHTWTLAAVYMPKPRTVADIFTLERRAKQRHHSSAYCPLCDPDHKQPPGCIRYPLPFSLDSTSLRKG